jgi:hypothetical protein
MGWNSCTPYFDDTVRAAKEVIEDLCKGDSRFDEHEALLRIAKPLANHLDDGDWDVHSESEFWDELGPDLWPEEYKEYLYWKRVDELD